MTDWIKVEDRLPKIGEYVLVCYKAHNKNYPAIAYRTRKNSITNEVKWYGEDGFDLPNVTHWAQIKLPKESTEESIKKIQESINNKSYYCNDAMEKQIVDEIVNILRDNEKFQEFSKQMMQKIILGE